MKYSLLMLSLVSHAADAMSKSPQPGNTRQQFAKT
jgi:hypothetical protein